MALNFAPKNNPRVIIIQKIYSKLINDNDVITYPKHRFKKFIKDVVTGTIERNDVICEEILKHLGSDLKLNNMDKLFQAIIKCAIFEFLYKTKISKKIIIKEYLNASNFFITNEQTKYLNALLDKIVKKIRTNDE